MAKNDFTSAPFNMALATLEKVNELLKRYATISTFYFDGGVQMEKGQAQHTKARILRQIFLQSIPLFDIEADREFKEEINKETKEIFNKLEHINILNPERKVIGKREHFNQDIENELDDILIKIEEKLQEHRYFMPSKKDPRFTWGNE